jgi:hypothetical protein
MTTPDHPTTHETLCQAFDSLLDTVAELANHAGHSHARTHVERIRNHLHPPPPAPAEPASEPPKAELHVTPPAHTAAPKEAT